MASSIDDGVTYRKDDGLHKQKINAVAGLENAGGISKAAIAGITALFGDNFLTQLGLTHSDFTDIPTKTNYAAVLKALKKEIDTNTTTVIYTSSIEYVTTVFDRIDDTLNAICRKLRCFKYGGVEFANTISDTKFDVSYIGNDGIEVDKPIRISTDTHISATFHIRNDYLANICNALHPNNGLSVYNTIKEKLEYMDADINAAMDHGSMSLLVMLADGTLTYDLSGLQAAMLKQPTMKTLADIALNANSREEEITGLLNQMRAAHRTIINLSSRESRLEHIKPYVSFMGYLESQRDLVIPMLGILNKLLPSK